MFDEPKDHVEINGAGPNPKLMWARKIEHLTKGLLNPAFGVRPLPALVRRKRGGYDRTTAGFAEEGIYGATLPLDWENRYYLLYCT